MEAGVKMKKSGTSISTDGVVKNKGGRPTTYTKEYLDSMAVQLIDWYMADENRVFPKEFAVSLRINPKMFTRFCDRSKKFAEAYDLAKEIMETRMCKMMIGTSKNKANVVGLIWVSKNTLGWKDKDETRDNDLSTEELKNLKELASQKAKNNS